MRDERSQREWHRGAESRFPFASLRSLTRFLGDAGPIDLLAHDLSPTNVGNLQRISQHLTDLRLTIVVAQV